MIGAYGPIHTAPPGWTLGARSITGKICRYCFIIFLGPSGHSSIKF